MSAPRQIRLRCPDCQSELLIDAATGAILEHKKAKEPVGGGKDFETLLADLGSAKTRAEELFEREKAALADRDRLLEERFAAALKRAEEDPDEGPPKRPFDLD